MKVKRPKIAFLESIAEEVKAFLIVGQKFAKKEEEQEEEQEEEFVAPALEQIDVPELIVKSLKSPFVGDLDKAVKSLYKFGKTRLADALKTFSEKLINDFTLGRELKKGLIEKLAMLFKEIATPDVYQKTGLIKTLYPTVQSIASGINSLSDCWRELENALIESKKRAPSQF